MGGAGGIERAGLDQGKPGYNGAGELCYERRRG